MWWKRLHYHLLGTSQSKRNRFGLVFYLPELTRKAVCHCMYLYVRSLLSDCARALGAYAYPTKKALCRWAQLLVLLTHIFLDPFIDSRFRACYNKFGHSDLCQDSYLSSSSLCPGSLTICLEPLVDSCYSSSIWKFFQLWHQILTVSGKKHVTGQLEHYGSWL